MLLMVLMERLLSLDSLGALPLDQLPRRYLSRWARLLDQDIVDGVIDDDATADDNSSCTHPQQDQGTGITRKEYGKQYH